MLGSSNVVANSSGVLQNESDFYPFGGEAAITQSLTNQHYRFEGKERDPESASVAEPQGLDNFGARFDSSAMGRFMSPDWASSAEPVPYAKLENPQSLNLYSFAQNNPESDPDINGHQRAIACDFSCESAMSDYLNSTASDEIAFSIRLSVAMITGYSDDWLEGAFMLDTGMSFEGAAAGEAQQQTAQQQAAAIPGSVKSAIMNSVNASNAPSGADTTGGFHEEGGIAGTNASGGVVISPAIPGAYSPSGVVSTNLMPVDPSLNASMSTVTVSWHVHPNGRTAAGDLAWNQPPSGQDQRVAAGEHQAVPGLIHIVVGAGNKTVYFYNGSSSVQSMSLKNFMKP
jgi:RHS repeat-associated protein